MCLVLAVEHRKPRVVSAILRATAKRIRLEECRRLISDYDSARMDKKNRWTYRNTSVFDDGGGDGRVSARHSLNQASLP